MTAAFAEALLDRPTRAVGVADADKLLTLGDLKPRLAEAGIPRPGTPVGRHSPNPDW